ncbi:zinc carboxypeptidase domain-containing protein [Ditylenchus destructor]|nr:zinc carboxypeptidase domain-containing protein [Ditylenchus destructor]
MPNLPSERLGRASGWCDVLLPPRRHPQRPRRVPGLQPLLRSARGQRRQVRHRQRGAEVRRAHGLGLRHELRPRQQAASRRRLPAARRRHRPQARPRRLSLRSLAPSTPACDNARSPRKSVCDSVFPSPACGRGGGERAVAHQSPSPNEPSPNHPYAPTLAGSPRLPDKAADMAVFTAATAPRVAPVLPELQELWRLIDQGGDLVRARELTRIKVAGGELPVVAVTMGNPDPSVPGIGFIGGVHGLERIGAQVVLAFLGSLVRRLRWDLSLHQQLESLRLVFLPVVNPGGVLMASRANPAGVDLMRNAPQDAEHPVPFLVGGQRLSSRLPWYRGAAGAPLQPESDALCRLIREELRGPPGRADHRLPFRLRPARPHLVSLCAQPQAHAASGRGPRAVRGARPMSVPASLSDGAAEPSLPDPRRSLGPPVRRIAHPRSRGLSADDARNGVMAVGQEKSAPATLPARHVQSVDRASPAARVASTHVLAGLHDACRPRCGPMAAGTGVASGSRRTGAHQVVSQEGLMEGQGGGQTWVLLRGLTRESAHWGDFPARLLRALRIQQPRARLELLDLPGNGDKHRQSSPTHVEDMMEDCRAELRRRGVPPPYQLLAMSLGAMVASEWAARYPGELSAIVLINTSLRPFSAFFRRLRPSNYWSLLMRA